MQQSDDIRQKKAGSSGSNVHDVGHGSGVECMVTSDKQKHSEKRALGEGW